DAASDVEILKPAPALLTKSLYLYFPDTVLPIYSTEHMRHFVDVLSEGRMASQSTGPRLNNQLLTLVKTRNELAPLSPTQLMRFLYWWTDPRDVVVKIAPGHEAVAWPDCLKNGYICVGWDE